MSDFASLIRLAIERGQAPTTPLVERPPIERYPQGEGWGVPSPQVPASPAPPPAPGPTSDAPPAPVEHQPKELDPTKISDPGAQRDFISRLTAHGLPADAFGAVGSNAPTFRQFNVARADATAPQPLGGFASQFAVGGQGPKSYTHSLRPERGTVVR